MSAVCFSRLDSAATCVVAHVRHAKPAKARCFLFNHFPAHRLPCMCLCLRTCACVQCGCWHVCAFPGSWSEPSTMIVGLCRVSFTPVRARDTVKLIEPKHSFARGFPPEKTRPKNKVINMLHVKACCCCQCVVGISLFYFYCATERKQQQRAKSPLLPCLCVNMCYMCVCCVCVRERVNSEITREALQWKLIMRL